MVATPGNRRVHQMMPTEHGAALEHEVTQLLRHRFEAAFAKVPAASARHWLTVMKAFVS